MASTLLEPDSSNLDAQLYEKLLLEAVSRESGASPGAAAAIPTVQVIPKPGYCVKTKTDNGEKVFINICHSENVPVPKDLSEQELLELLDSDDPTGFRIPMSVGEPHAELDHSGKGCTTYDVVVHPDFFRKMQESEVFKTFFLTVTLEGVEAKYDTSLNREWVILKNKKFIGSLPEQNIRTQSKPLIMDMDRPAWEQGTLGKGNPLISEIDSQQDDKTSRIEPETLRGREPEYHYRGREPEYRIIQEPPEGQPEFLVAEINLPQVKVANSVSVDIGEDRIMLGTRSSVYHLDIYLPYNLVQEECGAQFNRKTRILTLTMPVQAV